MVCYDLIPILFPQFYLPRDRDVFVNYFRKAIGFVDKFVCISNCTARDVVRFAAEQGRRVRDVGAAAWVLTCWRPAMRRCPTR